MELLLLLFPKYKCLSINFTIQFSVCVHSLYFISEMEAIKNNIKIDQKLKLIIIICQSCPSVKKKKFLDDGHNSPTVVYINFSPAQ